MRVTVGRQARVGGDLRPFSVQMIGKKIVVGSFSKLGVPWEEGGHGCSNDGQIRNMFSDASLYDSRFFVNSPGALKPINLG